MTSPLPHALRVLAEAAGEEAALTIALALGGTRLSVPRRVAGSKLESVVGLDAAERIAQQLGGAYLTIPQARRQVSDWLRERGWSQEKRANVLKCSRSTIQNWDSGADTSRQWDLFDA